MGDSGNLATYSPKCYQLFLCLCTEFESICKGILEANGYIPKDKNGKPRRMWNIEKDYFRISQVVPLARYSCSVSFLNYEKISPFSAWNDSQKYKKLNWYQDYNDVKHSRSREFKKANLENVIYALAAVKIMLHAQYGNTSGAMTMVLDDGTITESDTSSPLQIIPPKLEEYKYQYDFDWTQTQQFDCIDFRNTT